MSGRRHVSVVQFTDTWERNDAAGLQWLDLALCGVVRLQGHVRPVDVILAEVLSEVGGLIFSNFMSL